MWTCCVDYNIVIEFLKWILVTNEEDIPSPLYSTQMPYFIIANLAMSWWIVRFWIIASLLNIGFNPHTKFEVYIYIYRIYIYRI